MEYRLDAKFYKNFGLLKENRNEYRPDHLVHRYALIKPTCIFFFAKGTQSKNDLELNQEISMKIFQE